LTSIWQNNKTNFT